MRNEVQQPGHLTPPTALQALPPLVQIALGRSRLIWITSLAVALLAVVIALLLPDRYTATVVIMPPQQSGSSSASMLAQLSNMGAMSAMGGGMGIKNPNDLQVALLKSRTVENALVARFQLQARYHRRYVSSARKRWERMTNVDNGLKDGLIRISVTDYDPRRAAEMATGWVEEYRRVTASLAVTEASQRRIFLERELSGARDELTRAEEDLKQTEQRTGVVDVDGQARAMIASSALLRAQVTAKQVEIRSMREFAAGQNPDLVRAEEELNVLESRLAEMSASSDRSEGDLSMPKGKITQDGLDYERALREMKYREAMYEILTRQYEVARVDEARQGSLVQVVDPALVPDRPTSFYRIWVALGGFLCALPVGLIAAWISEMAKLISGLRRRTGSWAMTVAEGWKEFSTGSPDFEETNSDRSAASRRDGALVAGTV